MNAKTVSWLCEKKSDSDVMMATWSTYLIFKFCGCLISVECKIEFNLNVTFFYYWSKTWNFKWSSFIDGLKLGTRLREIVTLAWKKAVFKKFVEDVFKSLCNKYIKLVDSAHFLSVARLEWQALLKETEVELEPLADMY